MPSRGHDRQAGDLIRYLQAMPALTKTSWRHASLRGMLRASIVGICTALALLPTHTANAARKQRPASAKCTPGHSRLIAADTQAQVFAIPQLAKVLFYVGCAYGRKKSFVIGSANECSPHFCNTTSNVTLAGPIVAYENSHFVEGPLSPSETVSRFFVVVRDLRTGRVIHKVPTGKSLSNSPNLVGAGETKAIVVKADGAVAWIVETKFEPRSEYEVHALDMSGSRVLASGADIAPRSLALADSVLYWTQGGKPFSALLN